MFAFDCEKVSVFILLLLKNNKRQVSHSDVSFLHVAVLSEKTPGDRKRLMTGGFISMLHYSMVSFFHQSFRFDICKMMKMHRLFLKCSKGGGFPKVPGHGHQKKNSFLFPFMRLILKLNS